MRMSREYRNEENKLHIKQTGHLKEEKSFREIA